jgi:uncharacterized protein
MPQTRPILIDNILLWVTEDCNLRCSYCYVRKNSKSLPVEKIDELLDFIQKSPSLFNKNVIVNFTGGEPLLRMDMIKEFIERLLRRRASIVPHLHFGVITNGTLLNDDNIDFLGSNGFQVLFSCDGTPETTDAHRPRLDGKSSHRPDLKDLISMMKSRNIKVKVRLTFTPASLNLAENVEYLFESGFDQVDILADMNESWEGKPPGNNGKTKTEALAESLKELASWFIQSARTGRIPKIDLFTKYLLLYVASRHGFAFPPRSPCTSGKSTIGITPDGDIYPCHHWHNQDNLNPGGYKPNQHRIGTVVEGIDEDKRRAFIEFSRDKIEECARCPARLICGGPCYAMSHMFYENIYERFTGQCRFLRELLIAVQYVYSRLKLESEDTLSRILRMTGPGGQSSCS